MSSPLFLVEQGDSNEGYLPRGRCEMLMAGATYTLWEAIYAFPEGSIKREWDEWVERMSVVAKGVFKQIKVTAKEEKHFGVSFVPFVLWNFLQLHSNYKNDLLEFDLSMILTCDPAGLPKGVKTNKLRACREDHYFVMDVEWMNEYVTTWNNRREEKGWPMLELDRTPYKGRFILSSEDGNHFSSNLCDRRLTTPANTDLETPSQSRPALEPKPLLEEAQLKPLKRRRNKGKGVDRSEPASETSRSRGRSHEPRKLSGNSTDDLTVQATSASKPSTSTSSRRSSRRRTPSRAPVPKIVSRRSSSPPPKRLKTAKSVTLDLTPSTRSPSRSRSDPKPKTRLKSAMTVPSTSARTPPTANELEVLSAVLRDVLPSRFIMNNKSGVLWTGFLLLPPDFWLRIPKDRRLDLFQQALVSCDHCSIIGFPCYRQLGISVACIRCTVQRIQCSQTFRKDGTNIENPYAHMLARYMLCWQIHHWEREEPLIIAYRDFTGCSLMPGVPLKYMPGMRAGKSKEKKAVAVARVVELSNLKGWEKYWHGIDYKTMARTWRYLNSEAKGSLEAALKNTPQFGAPLPDDIQNDIDSYYEKLLKSDPTFKLKSDDKDDEDEDDDEDSEMDEDEGEDEGEDDQSVPGSSTSSVVGSEVDLDDAGELDDISHETDEHDDDTITPPGPSDTLLAGNPSPSTDDVLPSVADAPSPIDDVLPSIDDVLPPTNATPSPIDTTLPSIDNASAPIDNAPPSTDSMFSFVDGPLTPIESTPSPIDVSLSTNDDPSPTNDAPLPTSPQADIIMHDSDQNADGDVDAMTLSDIINYPTSPSHSVAGTPSRSRDAGLSISTSTQPVAEIQPLPTNSRIPLNQVFPPSNNLGTPAKELPSESEAEELQRLRRALPGLTEEVKTQQRLVTSLHGRIADIEHEHKQTRQQLDAVNEELRVTKLQYTLLREQSTTAADVALASIVGQMGSLQESQTKAIHSAVVQSLEKVFHDAVRFWAAAPTTTPTHAGDSTSPQPFPTLSLSPNRLNRHPNPNTSSRYSEHSRTAIIIDPSSTAIHPSTSSFVSSSIVATHVTGPVPDVEDTLGSKEGTM